jgi:hypothetical protein
MTTNYKILGQTRPSANTEAINYVVPTETSTLVKSININNTSSTADSYSIALLDNADSSQVSYTVLQKPYANRVEISTDLVTWTNASMPFPGEWGSVTYGPAGWVASGYDSSSYFGLLAKTTDLSVPVWENANGMATFPVNGQIAGSFYANSAYYFYTISGIVKSTDLVSWTNYAPYMMNGGVVGCQSVAYGNGKLVAVPGASSAIWYSTDGFTWDSASIGFTSNSPSKVTFVNNMFVINPDFMNGSSDNIAISTDAITWTISTIGYSSGWRSGVAYNNGKYVMAPYTNINLAPMVPEAKVAISTDLITWTVNDLPPSGDMMFNGTYLKDVAFLNNHFVISGEMSGKYYKSTDAVTWTIGDAIDGMMDGPLWEDAHSQSLTVEPSIQEQDYIAYNVTVDANETITIKSGYTLSENNAIFVKSENGTTTFSTFGAEIS